MLYPGGWVRTSYLSQRFEINDPTCIRCRRATCGPWWYHVERGDVLCYRCSPEPPQGYDNSVVRELRSRVP